MIIISDGLKEGSPDVGGRWCANDSWDPVVDKVVLEQVGDSVDRIELWLAGRRDALVTPLGNALAGDAEKLGEVGIAEVAAALAADRDRGGRANAC